MLSRHCSRDLLTIAALCACAAPTQARAAEPPSDSAGKCPPGAYCEQAEHAPPPELAEDDGADAEAAAAASGEAGDGAGTTVVIPPPPPGADPNAPRVLVVQPSAGGAPGQVIVYEAGAAPPHLPGASEPVRPVPPPPPPPPQREWRRHRSWGMNLRIDGVLMPRYRSYVESAGMIGLGMGLRYRPVPFFAVGLDADFLGGIDSMGYERREIPVALNAIFYPNPRDVVQFYAFGGLHFAFAQVYSDRYEVHLADGTSDEYTYMGGQLGLGLEFRVSEMVGINIDGYGLLRARTDDDSDGLYPELYDPREGRASNVTGVGVLRGGVTFWW